MSLISKPRLALLAAVVALAGCGRRGDLEAPPRPDALQSSQTGHEIGGHGATKIVPPKKDFVLDPLLQ